MKIKDLFFQNLANMITTSRLIFSVWLVTVAISAPQQLALMLLLVILSGASDALDGWVARKFKIVSDAGGFIDRMADKIYICPTIVVLVWRYWPAKQLPVFFKLLTEGLVALVVLLEIVLVIFGIVGLVKKLDTSANQWGKRKMIFQSIAVSVWFVALNISHYLKINILVPAIFLIDLILIFAVGWAVKSIEAYWQRYGGVSSSS